MGLTFRRRNVPYFYSKSFGFSDFKQTQDTVAFLTTTQKKKSLFSSKRTLAMEYKHSQKSADLYGGNINRDYISYVGRVAQSV